MVDLACAATLVMVCAAMLVAALAPLWKELDSVGRDYDEARDE